MTSYSYTPKALVASYAKLKAQEAEYMERAMQIDTSTSIMASNGTAAGSNTLRAAAASGKFVVAAVQITGAGLPDSDVSGYCFRAELAIQKAAAQGAHLILLPELWSGPYFCQSQDAVLLQLADEASPESNILIRRMQMLAALYKVMLPVSIYERCGNCFYNSVVMIDADGSILGKTYRKTHIPDGTGYQEKFYFTPGDSGFHVYRTKAGLNVGIAICWDQWFPEAARCLALQGADVLLYPTAIGSEPQDASLYSADHWQRVMQGHAAANMIPVVASNRFGTEVLLHADGTTEKQQIKFYGRSFISDNTGAIIVECPSNEHNEPVFVIVAEVDTVANRQARAGWGLFRDRRPSMYQVILTKDGKLD